MALEKILTDGSETGGSSADKINLGFDATDENTAALNGSSVVTENVTKTVGTGKDFETLHLALRWLEKVTQTSGQIYFQLDDGIHVLGGQGEFDENSWAYYKLSYKSFKVQSASGDKTLCSITIDGFDDLDNYPSLFELFYCSLSMGDVTLDMALDGYPYPTHVDFSYSTEVYLYISRTAMNNFAGLYITDGCTGAIRDVSLDNTPWGISVLRSVTFLINSGCSVSNSDYGVRAKYGANITMTAPMTFTNNTQDTNIPLNEIQYDGSFITDGTGALSFKA